jgi:hypothetical protein
MNHDPADSPDRLDEALARLPRGIDPGRDLWPGIASRLEPRAEPARRPAMRPWAWAAAAVLLVGASSLITATLMRRETATTAQAPAAPVVAPTVGPEVVPAAAGAAFGPGNRVGPAYLANRRMLARELEQRLARLPPEGREQLAKNLAELRRASTEINAALELHPGDPLLEELLFNIYQDEISVLANVDRLTAADTTTDPTRIPL